MFNKPSPITQMLIREMQEVKLLIRDIHEKLATIDVDEVLEKHKDTKR
jgi:hypothetical protein